MLRSPLRKTLFAITLLGILGVFGYVGWVVVFINAYSPEKLAQALSEYQAGGGFIELSDITSPRYEGPYPDDGGLIPPTALHWVYEQSSSYGVTEESARVITKTWFSTKKNTSTRAWNRSHDDIAAIQALLNTHRSLLEEFETYIDTRPPSPEELGQLLYPNPRNLTENSMPTLSFCRFVAELLSLDVEVAVSEGDIDGAVSRLNRIFEFGVVIMDLPNMIEYTTGLAIHRIGFTCLEGLVNLHILSHEQLESIAGKIDSIQPFSMYSRALLGDGLYALSVYAAVDFNDFKMAKSLYGTSEKYRGYPAIIGIPWLWSDYQRARYGRVLLRASEMRYLECITWLNEVHPKSFASVYPLIKDFDEMMETEEQDPFGMVSGLFLHSSSSYSLAVYNLARKRIFLSILGSEQYFLKHGKYPQVLKQLVPDYLSTVPIDPYTEYRLRISLVEDFYTLYAYGENLVDDRGENLEFGEDNSDIGVRISF